MNDPRLLSSLSTPLEAIQPYNDNIAIQNDPPSLSYMMRRSFTWLVSIAVQFDQLFDSQVVSSEVIEATVTA